MTKRHEHGLWLNTGEGQRSRPEIGDPRPVGAGISIKTGFFADGLSRIEGNTVTDNAVGIDVDATDNIIIRNFAFQNTVNFSILISWAPGTGSGAPTNHPWVNFELWVRCLEQNKW